MEGNEIFTGIELVDMILPTVFLAAGAGLAFGWSWVKAKAKESENKFDDKLVELVEAAIVKAKEEESKKAEVKTDPAA